MLKRLFLAAMIALFFALIPATAAGQEPAPTSEDTKTRLNKQEIIDLMLKAGRIPRLQQDNKMDAILKSESDKTPRSDFMFCAGLAYLENPKAQTCLGNAFEKGRGIVEDLTEAYTWYAHALENHPTDKAVEQQAQAGKDRVKVKLQSSYPAPTDDDLEDHARQQKNRIAQYKEEAKKAKK